ncbi:MAG TPA: aggregation factor core protein MAFp3, isoform C, partial [Cyanobacteria bacterium UBA11372]|nr:aggregation factor core protein MAFp3, isoform C [Cyanobacteria bacterium UBA11372]
TQNTATLSILDNDSSIQFSSPVFSVNEDGTPVLAVTVTRTGNTTNAATATVNLTNGTATGGSQPFAAGTDFDNAAQVVSFASGETSKTLVIPINNDTLVEATETVNLTLTNPTGGATIGAENTATLNILDNDSTIQFSSPVFSVNEDGTPIAAVTVTRTGDTTTAAAATVNLTNGTATGGSQPFAAGTDYNNAAQVVNFAIGETSKTVVIP